MENREILVANTKTQKRSKITTAATTLGELKQALRAAGVDYTGMTFTEGISKTQLLDDSTQLPQKVMYKGQPTNNLVILLTNTKKNIASGAMSRKEAYQTIKEHNLQDAVKEEYGRNFTQVPTSDLVFFIENNVDTIEEEDAEDTDNYEDDDTDNMEDENVEDNNEEEAKPRMSTLAEALNYIVDYAIHAGSLNYEQAMFIAKNTENLADKVLHKKFESYQPVSTSDGGITDTDIDDMISDLSI